MERRRTSFVYHAWALTTYFEAFVLLVAALAPFTSFAGLGRAARAARPLGTRRPPRRLVFDARSLLQARTSS